MSSTDEPEADGRRRAESLVAELYAELRRVAAGLSAGLAPGQTLQPTALVHEAYLRLVRAGDPGWDDRRHFFGAAARAMRDVLVDQARRKGAAKRGGAADRVPLADGLAWVEPPADDLLAVDEALGELEAADATLAELVRLRFYAGLTLDETAEVLGVSVSTVQREWRYARAWLADRVRGGPPPG